MRRPAIVAAAALCLWAAAPVPAAEKRKGGNPFADPRVQEAFRNAGIELPDWKPVVDEGLGCKVLVPTSWVAGKDFFLERAPPFQPPTLGGFETKGKSGTFTTTGGPGPGASGFWKPPSPTGDAKAGTTYELRTSFYEDGKEGCSIRRTRTDRPFTDQEKAQFKSVGATLRTSR